MAGEAGERAGLDLLELFRPPDNYSFVRGVMLTHDLDWSIVAEQVCPRLAKVSATGRRGHLDMRNASVGDDAPRLAVVHSAEASTTVGSVVPWATAMRVRGRRQHAKAILLQFENETRGRVHTRVAVGSANLTRSGLTRNRELAVWDEVGHTATRPFLGRDVVRALERLGEDKELGSSDQRRQLRSLLQQMHRHIGAAPTGGLRSSLIHSRPMLSVASNPPVADRIVVISPAFGAATDVEVAAVLGSRCRPNTVVEIHTGYDGTKEAAREGHPGLVWPSRFIEALKATGASVELHAVPEIDGEGLRRRLHGKLLALEHRDGSVEVLVGSANCTSAGLLGRNRELMLSQSWDRPELQRLVDGLGSVRYRGSITPPEPKVQPRGQSPPQVVVEFHIDPTSSADDASWAGTWVVTGDVGQCEVVYRGETIPAGESKGWLDPSCGAVVLEGTGRRDVVVVDVTPPAGHPGFWGRFVVEPRQDRPAADLLRLLGDIDRVRVAPATSGKGSKASGDDRLTVPLEQRAVLLVRYRQQLAGLPDRKDLLLRYLSGGRAQSLHGEEQSAPAVVSSVLAAYDAGDGEGTDDLLGTLTRAVAPLDSRSENEEPDR